MTERVVSGVPRWVRSWALAFIAVPAICAASVDLKNTPANDHCNQPPGTASGRVELTCTFSGAGTACPDRTAAFTLPVGGDASCAGNTVPVPSTNELFFCADSVPVDDDCSDSAFTEASAFVRQPLDLPPTLAGNCIGSSGPSDGFTGDPGGGETYAPDCSPIIIDLDGTGFHLTSAAAGVLFDIRGDGHPVQIAWTAPGYRNAFLALDRNHNGTIDNGTELFGNFTPQPRTPHPNGFVALAEFDRPENGGNQDGVIDERDAAFGHLLLWIDENHDGIAQPGELHSLAEMGVHALSLRYQESQRRDEFGNLFRYRARVNPADHGKDPSDVGPWAYDVFLAVKGN